MKLEQKGVIQSLPILPGPAEATSRSVQSWSGVIAATHWHLYRREQVDGADFYVGAEELGHLHLDGEAHLATSPGFEGRADLARAGALLRLWRQTLRRLGRDIDPHAG